MLDKNIFQILLTDTGVDPELPPDMRRNVQSFHDHHPDFAYKRLMNSDLRSVIESNFDRDVLDAYDTLQPFCYKSDLGRFCLLLLYGGIYADMAIRLLRPVEMSSGKAIVCFRDTPGSGLWTVSTSLIAAKAGRNEFRLAIEMICKNVKTRHYGANALHPTGPAVFGRDFAIEDRLEDIDFGTFEYLAECRSPQNVGHVDSAGRVVSMRMKSGSFTELGIAGTNDYTEIWRRRQVYGEKQSRFPAGNLNVLEGLRGLTRERDSIRYASSADNFIVFGPHLHIPPGDYVATYVFEPGSIVQGLIMDVLTGEGDRFEVLCRRALGTADQLRAKIGFSIGSGCIYQVRLSSPGGASGTVLGLEIEALAPSEERVGTSGL